MVMVEINTKERSRPTLTLEGLVQKDLGFLTIKEHDALDSANGERFI